jgi:hypothetical protein
MLWPLPSSMVIPVARVHIMYVKKATHDGDPPLQTKRGRKQPTFPLSSSFFSVCVAVEIVQCALGFTDFDNLVLILR